MTRHRYKQETSYSTGAREVIPVNSAEGSWAEHRYLLWFGQVGTTYLLVWGNHLDDALEAAVDWIVDNAPGLLSDEYVEEEYKRLVAEGMDEEEAQAEAEVDQTMWGHNGIHYIPSDEWGIEKEDPSRADILALQGRPKEHRARGVDVLARKARKRRGR